MQFQFAGHGRSRLSCREGEFWPLPHTHFRTPITDFAVPSRLARSVAPTLGNDHVRKACDGNFPRLLIQQVSGGRRSAEPPFKPTVSTCRQHKRRSITIPRDFFGEIQSRGGIFDNLAVARGYRNRHPNQQSSCGRYGRRWTHAVDLRAKSQRAKKGIFSGS